MERASKLACKRRDWSIIAIAGLVAFFLTAAALGHGAFLPAPLDLNSVGLGAVAGALFGMLLAAAVMATRIRRQLCEHNFQLDAALNHMSQGLCMFDAQRRLVLWNEPYRAMYSIDPRQIHRGCTVNDLLKARIGAGTFPLDPRRYESDLLVSIGQRKTFKQTIELADGRSIAVVNQPITGGGWLAMHEDVTERTRADRELEHTRSFLDTILENVPCPIVVKNLPSLRYSFINRAAEKYMGIGRDTILGKTSSAIMSKATAELIEADDRKLIAAGEAIFIDEHAVLTPGNGTRIVSATRLPVFNTSGKPEYLITVINDLTDRKRSEQQIKHLANHDSMTGLPNRAAFSECLSATIGMAAESSQSFAILCIDLDCFKEVNDVFGIAGGDAVLTEVARRMETASQGAFLARTGSDEFAVITPTGNQPAAAEALVDRLYAMLDADIQFDGKSLRVGLTTGISIFPQDGSDAATLIANADAALFRAKTEARGSIRFFEPSMDRRLREKRALQQDLHAAIARGEIELHYQPQAKIDGAIIGFEALARWRHPRHGMVPPTTFIPLAEESGLVGVLGEWILRAACREAASWPCPLRIAVNLSPAQFARGDLAELVHQVLLDTGLPAERLEVEITEGVLMGDFNCAMSILRRLKSMGVRIAMDDFGTGYSSLSYLQSFPFDKIKIDRTFISHIGRSQQAATIIRAVIALGRGLDLPVIAEGVETDEQLRFLTAENCDEIQGYLVGRPKPIAEYVEMIGRPGASRRNAVTVALKAAS